MVTDAGSPLATPCLVALDWGTSSLRASLMSTDGHILETRNEPWGIMHIPKGDFASAFHAITAEWRWHSVNALAAGMIGSPIGWITAPYCSAPAGADDLAAALTIVPGVPLSIVPGVAACTERPDMMRGEETQIIGALALHPHLASLSLVVLPGTHSKWVQVVQGRITDVTTYMTGELFAVLREHSILGRTAVGSPTDEVTAALAFGRGVLAAQSGSAGLAPLLFSARALVVAKQLDDNASLEYLSGLLIGDELRCGLMGGVRPAALVGDPALCARYVAALRLLDIPDVPVILGAAEAGLWSIARLAGLTRSAESAE